jgi:glyoxylase-like metal-dependent hydrolase (beta-lactamase superfamily II)
MPASLLRDPHNNPVLEAAQAGTSLRLSVNCFALAGPGVDGILIDGGAGWKLDPTMGHLEQAMAEAEIDPASITVFAITHTHPDHVNGLLTPDGRVLLPNLKAIVISEAAVDSFFAEAHLAQFRPLLKGVRNGGEVAERLKAFDLPGHAPGHAGYASTRMKTASCPSGTSFMCRRCSSVIPRSLGVMMTIRPSRAQPV